MKQNSKQEKPVPSQEGSVELSFPRGVHPSKMTTEESKAYWAFYTCEKKFDPLPREDEDYEE
jgi:hypothetical protein